MTDAELILECPFCGHAPEVFLYRYGVGQPCPEKDLVICETRGCPTSKVYVERQTWNSRRPEAARYEGESIA